MRCLFHSNNRFNGRKLHTSRLSIDELGWISSSRSSLVSFYIQQQWWSIKTLSHSTERWEKQRCLRAAAHSTSERRRMNHLSQNHWPWFAGNSPRHFKTNTIGSLLTYRLVRRYRIWLDYSFAIFSLHGFYLDDGNLMIWFVQVDLIMFIYASLFQSEWIFNWRKREKPREREKKPKGKKFRTITDAI